MVNQSERCCAHGGLTIYVHNELEQSVLSQIDISKRYLVGMKLHCASNAAFKIVKIAKKNPKYLQQNRHFKKNTDF